MRSSVRFRAIKEALLSSPIHLCIERAILITDYFKQHDDRSLPMVIRKARAFRHLLAHKSIILYDRELIVGNTGTYRKSAIIQPELAGVFSSYEK